MDVDNDVDSVGANIVSLTMGSTPILPKTSNEINNKMP